MPVELAERTELNRLADDGCPHVSGDSRTYDLTDFWDGLEADTAPSVCLTISD